MAKITIISTYESLVQAQPEKKGNNANGTPYVIPAVPAGTVRRALAKYDEVTLEFTLPQGFTEKLDEGDVINVQCPDLEKIKPFRVWNVDRIIKAQKKDK